MGAVIYSSTTFQEYFWDYAGLLLFGVAAIVVALKYSMFGPKQDIYWRIFSLAVGVFVIVFFPQRFMELQAEINATPITIAALVEQKDSYWGDWDDEAPTPYALQATAGSEEIIFFVRERAFKQAKFQTCYNFTFRRYYPNPYIDSIGSLNTKYAGKLSVGHVTRIELTDAAACR